MFTYSKIEVAASLSQNSGHLPACCIKLVCPALPAFLGNRLIYLYHLYYSMGNQAWSYCNAEYWCTINCCCLFFSSSQELLVGSQNLQGCLALCFVKVLWSGVLISKESSVCRSSQSPICKWPFITGRPEKGTEETHISTRGTGCTVKPSTVGPLVKLAGFVDR